MGAKIDQIYERIDSLIAGMDRDDAIEALREIETYVQDAIADEENKEDEFEEDDEG